MQEPMTIKAWPDLQTGTGEIEKNLNIFWGKVGKLFGGHSFSFLSLSHSKLRNVNMILFGAIPDATDAFPDVSIVYYSSKRYMYNQHFWKVPQHFI